MHCAERYDLLSFRETERPLRVLVIDESSSVRALLEMVLGNEGMTVDVAESREMAESFLADRRYDLLMIDEGRPSRRGVDFVRELRGMDVSTPALIMTPFPTAELVDAAFSAGASDFIKKPFAGITHLLSRVCLVAEQGTADRFFERMVSDLSLSARSNGPLRATYQRALRATMAARNHIERRPAAVMVDREIDSARATATILGRDGHHVETVSDAARALSRVCDPFGPLVLIMDLAVPGALSTIARARAVNLPPEIVVVGERERLFDALQGVDLGAADYCLRDERQEAFARRVSRTVDKARRKLLKRHVMDVVRQIRTEVRDSGSPSTDHSGEPTSENLDKRLSTQRHCTDIPAVLIVEGKEAVTARVRDVSSRGLFISTRQIEPRDTRVRVYIDAAEHGLTSHLEEACVVRWSVSYDPDPSEASGMGVSLLDPARSALSPLLEALRG